MLASYIDLMRAFMALRNGEQDHDIEAQTGLTPDHPDHKRIVACREVLQGAWLRSVADRETDCLGEYTVFCCQSDGRGTVWISSVQAESVEEAEQLGRTECALDWGWDEDDVHTLGVICGPANVAIWNDIGG